MTTSPLPTTTSPKSKNRSLVSPFNRAGTPRMADLGFDAHGENIGGEDSLHDQTANDLIGFPGERVPHVSYGFEGERWRIRNIVWIIGQSPTGAALLDHTYRAGYRLGFDAMANARDTYCAYINPLDKCIALDARAPVAQLVADLTLQLAIASSAVNGVLHDISMNPVAGILTHRMVMADALAVRQQALYQLRTASSLPAKADKSVYWHLVEETEPTLAAAYAETAVNAMAIENGAAMASVIRRFYQSPDLRLAAEQEAITYYRCLPTLTIKDSKLMNQSFDSEALIYKFLLGGMAYATKHEPRLILQDPVNLSVSTGSADVVNSLLQTRRNAGIKERAPWPLQVMDQV